MVRTFSQQLYHFSLAIDFIEDGQYSQIKKQITEYLRRNFDVSQVAFFRPCLVSEQPGLTTVWSDPIWENTGLLKEKSRYTRQIAFAIGEQKSLWVVSENGRPLSEANRGVDLWNNISSDKMPPFRSSPGRPCLTSIIMPTYDSRDQFNGAFLLDIHPKVLITASLKAELQTLSRAVGLLHATELTTLEQRSATGRAIGELEKILRTPDIQLGARPILFFAHSERADRAVVDDILEVIRSFDDHVDLRHWEAIHEPGHIPAQIVNLIQRSAYGICYFSEPSLPNASLTHEIVYTDNPNVLIEAGMLHVATSADGYSGWIPIREKNSPVIPFDLLGLRLVVVPRNQDNRLSSSAFKEALRTKLVLLLGGK